MHVIDYGRYDAIQKHQGWEPTQAITQCGCIGPQRGEPLCPCAMRGLIKRDGRWIKPEVDFGPVNET